MRGPNLPQGLLLRQVPPQPLALALAPALALASLALALASPGPGPGPGPGLTWPAGPAGAPSPPPVATGSTCCPGCARCATSFLGHNHLIDMYRVSHETGHQEIWSQALYKIRHIENIQVSSSGT